MAVHSSVGFAAYPSSRAIRRRKNERGFALLLVFLMASVVAITLYMEVPRVAMESERAKEALLIDRGEQYKRAIQLFTKKAGRYPGEIKELESFQNMRFLRHRYIDPMTGKDEWRVIHIQAGILIDSKLSAPQKPGEEKKDNGSFSGVENTFAMATANQQGGAAMAQRRRASDGGMAGMGPELPPVQQTGPMANGTPGSGGIQQLIPGQQNLTNPIQPGQPNQVQPIPGLAISGQPGGVNGQPGGLPGQPGQPVTIQPLPGGFPGQPGGIPGQPGGFPGQPGTFPGQPTQFAMPGGRPFPGQQPSGGANNPASGGGNSFGGSGNSFGGGGNSFASGTTTPSGMPVQPGQVVYQGQPLPGQPGAPVNSQVGGVSPYSTMPGANGNPPRVNQPGQVASPQSQAASDMINRILTSPRPGGMPTGAQTGGAGLGGGIAGVASNAEGEGVMVYNDHSLYQEWEFIYDPQKQKQIQNPNASGAVGTPAQQIGNMPGGTPGTPVQPNPTMQNPFGAQSPFGAQPPRPGR